nr:MAG TPA: baseplate protein [Caudoviricetes sp.]
MRTIDADKFILALMDASLSSVDEDTILDLVDSVPTVDAVIVTRCKDCKHLCVWNRKDIYAFCPKTNIVFLPFDKDTRTFFCSLGERKDGGDD